MRARRGPAFAILRHWRPYVGERIYIMSGEGLEPMEEEPFDLEDTLQALIAEHPELIDGEQVKTW